MRADIRRRADVTDVTQAEVDISVRYKQIRLRTSPPQAQHGGCAGERHPRLPRLWPCLAVNHPVNPISTTPQN